MTRKRRPLFYTLIGRLPVPCFDIQEWARTRVTQNDWHVAETHVGPMRVSTVFLGQDHNFGFGKSRDAILFETMIFGGDLEDHYQTRCATWAEAEAMHAIAVNVARSLLAQVDAMIPAGMRSSAGESNT